MLEEYKLVLNDFANLADYGIFQLAAAELPKEHYLANTKFAMYCKEKCPDSAVVIFCDGTVGLACYIGLSIWYLIHDYPKPMPSHQLGLDIDYIRTLEGWEKQ
jgi:hypothetical protein